MTASTIRYYGSAPFTWGTVHGGPGGIGACSDLSAEIHARFGVGAVEFLQTKYSVDDLCEELAEQVAPHAPLILLGHSWGAWLAALTAARHPELVSVLILVGTPPVLAGAGAEVERIRRSRFTPEMEADYSRILAELPIHPESLPELGKFCELADAYCPLETLEIPPSRFDGRMFESVWREASAMREAGVIVRCFRNLCVPVIAIHGDYDPHPASVIAAVIERTHILNRCGHVPWREKYARDHFFRLLAAYR